MSKMRGSISSYGPGNPMYAKRTVFNDGDFTAEQIAEFREVFNWFDKNHDEYINEIELGNAMRALGENPTQMELSELLKAIDSTKSSSYSSSPSLYKKTSISLSTSEMPTEMKADSIPETQDEECKNPGLLGMQSSDMYRVAQHKIDFSQFLIMMAHKMQSADDEKEIRDAFKVFDINNNGTIEKERFMKAMITVGEPLSKREVAMVFQQIGAKNQNTINYEDFIAFMLHDV
mmetsp:Transcript_26062/g.42599  ORF Transcript_26062/g.42599 Transcript_26062/m.42599 type:complete len:232 (-) Transcript_26062:79-774(-)